MKHDSPAKKGFQMLLNNPATSPFTAQGAQGFRALLNATEMPLHETVKYIGKRRNKPKDEDKSKQRLESLEAQTEQNTK